MNKLAVAGAVCLTGLILFWLFFVHYTDQYQVAISRDALSGDLHIDTKGGFHLTAPWVRAARIDLRPVRVCTTSTARAYNCKLVQFEPAAYKKFIKVQGFSYYWWANRISFNFGYNEEYRGMKDILRGYAFGSEHHPFVTILRDYTP